MTTAFDETKHPRSIGGRFANKSYADSGQLDLAVPPLGNVVRLYDLAGDRDVSQLDATDIARAAGQTDPELEAQLVDRLPNLGAEDRAEVAAVMSRGRLLSEWFGANGGEAARDALDFDQAHGTDLLGADPDVDRDAEGIDFESLAEHGAEFWSYEAFNAWENARRRNNGWV